MKIRCTFVFEVPADRVSEHNDLCHEAYLAAVNAGPCWDMKADRREGCYLRSAEVKILEEPVEDLLNDALGG
jgi:hypothetical protein